MSKRAFILFLSLSWLAVACQGAVTAEPAGSASASPTSSTPPPSPNRLITASPDPETASGAAPSGKAQCTVVSRSPTPGPTQESLFPEVSDSDWVKGPDKADVTVIEYSDFQ